MLSDWLFERGQDPNFETYDMQQLASTLRRFYGEVNNKKGLDYSKSSMLGIRSGINRHITGPPFNRIINIISDKEFMPANKVLNGRIKNNRALGLDQSSHKKPISEGDMKKLYTTKTLNNDSAESLLHKVFF